jgi:hypothetical protein
MLVFLLLLFLAGDVEKNPGPMGTPVSETNNKSLTIFHSNIRSFRNKINYISDIIEDFDIVFFTETHLDYLIPTARQIIRLFSSKAFVIIDSNNCQ